MLLVLYALVIGSSQGPSQQPRSILEIFGSPKMQQQADAWNLAPTEVQQGFMPLFDGVSFDGWEHGGNWTIQAGALYRAKEGGPLTYTRKTVPDDFELLFEWKVSKGCNSGVYYRPGQVEYQVLDNANSPYGENPRQAAASLFFCMAPSQDATRPHGQWNTGRVVCKGSVIQHWLNGERVLDFDYSDPKWAEMLDLLAIRGGNLAGRGGNLWLQDHGQPVWFRNLRWREIPVEEELKPSPNFQPMPIPPLALAKEEERVRNMLEETDPAVMQRGVRLFTNRKYVIEDFPDELNGFPFLRTSIDGVEVECVSAGELFALTPAERPGTANQDGALRRQNFERLDRPEFQLFPGEFNRVHLYRRRVHEGDRLHFGKWVLLVLGSDTKLAVIKPQPVKS